MASDQTIYALRLWIAGAEGMPSHPQTVFLRWQDFPMFLEQFLYFDYALPVSPSFSSDLVVMDLGGNSGMATLFFHHQYFPNARFIAVEPAENNLRVLRQNMQAANIKAEVVAAAVGAVSGEMPLETDCIGYNIHVKNPDASGPKVQVFTIDDLLKNLQIERVDLLKMDIEGAEKSIFDNPGPWISKVKAIILEIHGDFTEEHLRRAVAPFGFSVLPTRHAAVFWVA
jgi:FkbM family methyltransferase